MNNTQSLIVFHRGGGKSFNYPPNSFITFKWALDFGAKAVEYDVLFCKNKDQDKIIVVESRLLKENRFDIDNLNWEDIRKVNTGNIEYGSCSIMTLDDTFNLLENIQQQIHIKGNHPATLNILLSQLKGRRSYILTSFDIQKIYSIKDKDNSIKTGWIVKSDQSSGDESGADLTAQIAQQGDSLVAYTTKEINNILSQAKQAKTDVVILCGPRVKNKEIVFKIQREGFEVGAWGTGSNLKVAKRLIGFGINRLTIDNPEQLD